MCENRIQFMFEVKRLIFNIKLIIFYELNLRRMMSNIIIIFFCFKVKEK